MISQVVQVNKRLPNESEARHAEFSYEFPSTTQEALEKYGETLTLRLIHDSITLMLQAPARKLLEVADSGLTSEEYSEYVSGHMKDHRIEVKRSRGAAAPKISPYESVARDLADPSKRDAIIEKFRSLGINLDVNGSTSTPEDTEEASPEAARRRR
jgi:hypothetical protein